MKPIQSKTLTTGILSTLMLTISLNLAFGSTKPPFPVPPPPPPSLTVTPESLRTYLLERNISVIQSFLKVKDAKDQVTLARYALLPSINLGAMISSSASFGLSSIQFMLPFLAPSNWFNYKAQKQQFEADKLSYQIFELNTYSSALSTYYTYLTDQQTKDVYIQEYNDLKEIANIADHLVSIGAMDPNDVKPLRAAANLAGIQSSQLQQLNDDEVASMRRSLSLPVSTDLTIPALNQSAAEYESLTVNVASDKAYAIAPEHKQIQFLVNVAEALKWSAAFSWIGGGTVGSSGSPGSIAGPAKFGNMSFSGQSNLGFGLIPTISLANRNIEEVKLTDIDLLRATTQIIEGATKDTVESKKQVTWGNEAESEMALAYRVIENRFRLGLVTITELLVARTNMTNSSVAKVKALMNLNLQRVILHRAAISDQFAKIKGCDYDGANSKKASLDQLCLGKGSKN